MSRPRSNLRLKSKGNRSGKRFWSAIFWHPIHQKIIERSTGIEDDGTRESQLEAERIAWKILGEGSALTAGTQVLFEDLAANFWDFKGDYVRARLARDPEALSPEHCENQARAIRLHILPALGKLTFPEITPDVLDDLVTDLLTKPRPGTKRPLSSQTVSHAINATNPIFDKAIRKGWIKYNPTRSMLPAPVRAKPRDDYTPDEARAILDPDTVDSVWGPGPVKPREVPKRGVNSHPDFDPWVHYSVATLTAVTSQRIGSVLALSREDITLEEAGGVKFYRVSFAHSVARIRGIKAGSKTDKGAEVPVAVEIMDRLLPHLPASGLLFPGRTVHGVLSGKTCLGALQKAMERVGIPRAEQLDRLLGFHSFRHTFVTRASAAGLTEKQVQAFTEHKEKETTDDYRHLKAFDLLAALPVQRSMAG